MKGLSTYRPKNASLLSLLNSEILNTSAEESRGDSNSKRFARKQGHQLDHSRTAKTPRRGELKIKKCFETEKMNLEQRKKKCLPSGFIRQQELLIKIQSPNKSRRAISPVSTDRNTEATVPTKHLDLFDTPAAKTLKSPDLQQQLQVRNGQIMILEDENIRLREQIKAIESENNRLNLHRQKQYKAELNILQNQVRQLKKEIDSKNQQIKRLTKNQGTISRELKGVKYEKVLLQKQLEEMYTKRLPKQMKELMSFREISLLNHIEELRKELEKNKDDRDREIEKQLMNLKTNHCEKQGDIRKMEIHTHVLNKRIVDLENTLKGQEEKFNHSLNELQLTNSSLLDQLKKSRKQNLKLQRLNHLNLNHCRKKNEQDDSQSLNFSISPRSPRNL